MSHPELMDFEQFKTSWEAKLSTPASWETYKKMKAATQDELERYLDTYSYTMGETKEILVPKLRPAEYVLGLISSHPGIPLSLASTLPFDFARSYCFLPFRRTMTPLSSGQFIHTDAMKFQLDGGKEESVSMMADLATDPNTIVNIAIS
eukprot:gene19834-26524_t